MTDFGFIFGCSVLAVAIVAAAFCVAAPLPALIAAVNRDKTTTVKWDPKVSIEDRRPGRGSE